MWAAIAKAAAALLGLVRDLLMYRAGKDRAAAEQAKAKADAEQKHEDMQRALDAMSRTERDNSMREDF